LKLTYSRETIEKIRLFWNEEKRQEHSELMKTKWTEERRQDHSERMKTQWTEERRQEQSELMKTQWTEERRQEQSELMKTQWTEEKRQERSGTNHPQFSGGCVIHYEKERRYIAKVCRQSKSFGYGSRSKRSQEEALRQAEEWRVKEVAKLTNPTPEVNE
jgi:hypothetical protein